MIARFLDNIWITSSVFALFLALLLSLWEQPNRWGLTIGILGISLCVAGGLGFFIFASQESAISMQGIMSAVKHPGTFGGLIGCGLGFVLAALFRCIWWFFFPVKACSNVPRIVVDEVLSTSPIKVLFIEIALIPVVGAVFLIAIYLS
jgi:hypothetical protein